MARKTPQAVMVTTTYRFISQAIPSRSSTMRGNQKTRKIDTYAQIAFGTNGTLFSQSIASVIGERPAASTFVAP